MFFYVYYEYKIRRIRDEEKYLLLAVLFIMMMAIVLTVVPQTVTVLWHWREK